MTPSWNHHQDSAPSPAGGELETSGHTPGPWTAECERAEDNGPWAIFAGERLVAEAEWWDNAEANARLISAAPALLSALRLCINRIARPNLSPDASVVLEQARAAIAKAGASQ